MEQWTSKKESPRNFRVAHQISSLKKNGSFYDFLATSMGGDENLTDGPMGELCPNKSTKYFSFIPCDILLYYCGNTKWHTTKFKVLVSFIWNVINPFNEEKNTQTIISRNVFVWLQYIIWYTGNNIHNKHICDTKLVTLNSWTLHCYLPSSWFVVSWRQYSKPTVKAHTSDTVFLIIYFSLVIS